MSNAAIKAVLALTDEWDREATAIWQQVTRGQLNGAEATVRTVDAIRYERLARAVRSTIIDAEVAR